MNDDEFIPLAQERANRPTIEAVCGRLEDLRQYQEAAALAGEVTRIVGPASFRMSTKAYEELLAHGRVTVLAASGEPLPEDIQIDVDHEAGTVTLSRDPGAPVQVRYHAVPVVKPRREAQWKRETNRRFR